MALRTRLLTRNEQAAGVASALAAEEERRGGAAPDELDVHIRGCGVDVPEQPTIAIDPVDGPLDRRGVSLGSTVRPAARGSRYERKQEGGKRQRKSFEDIAPADDRTPPGGW